MSQIINLKTGKSEEVKEGEKIRDAIERLGAPFGCEDGICGMYDRCHRRI